MADHYKKVDQDSSGNGRVHETSSTGAGVQPRRIRADDQTNAGQAQYLKKYKHERNRKLYDNL